MALPARPRVTGRVIVMRDNKVLLFRRRRFLLTKLKWLKYYSIPGGGVDADEEPDAAARREMKEELGVTVELEREVAIGTSDNYKHHLFSGQLIEGEAEPSLQPESEEAMHSSRFNTYEAVWVDAGSLTVKNMVYYSAFLPVIQKLADGENISKPELVKL